MSWKTSILLVAAQVGGRLGGSPGSVGAAGSAVCLAPRCAFLDSRLGGSPSDGGRVSLEGWGPIAPGWGLGRPVSVAAGVCGFGPVSPQAASAQV